ncbi:MAG: uroporphyrinogen decarboxylase family protein [Anaerolineae bacterium]|jgi:uroporphyrinogen decarboxylase|nr:uroporphyrinogen decarboxylase family protein [Anaerolineae bacterium]MDH7472914.1 uroporphyrinogen decarboxylase family protein [Anaerolineae bacterium]
MNSRARVLTALRHEEPDRVPIDLGGMASTGIHAVAYNRLKRYLGLGGTTRVFDITQHLAEVEEPVRRRFGVDVIALPRFEVLPGVHNIHWQPWTLPDGSPAEISADFHPVRAADGGWEICSPEGMVLYRMPRNGFYFDPVEAPLAHADPTTLCSLELPRIGDEELRLLRERACTLYTETEYAIVGAFGGNLLEMGQSLRGWTQFMIDLASEPDWLEDFLERITEMWMESLARYLDAVGEYIQVIQFGDDLGGQQRLLISPAMYRRLFKPRHRRMYEYVHAHSNCAVFLHSCGAIYELIPDLIEAGVDVLNPVQTSAAGMDPARLKREFGDRSVFWGGGCNTQYVLPRGTPAEVAADVRERLRIFAPGGGYVFAAIHNILPEIPPENVVTMFDAVRGSTD